MRRRFLVVVGVLQLACSEPRARAAAPTMGQWIWSERDAQLFREAHAARPSLQGGVWVGTIALGADSVELQLGKAPLRDAGASTVVIRLDDSMHPLFAAASDSLIAARLTSRLEPLLAIVDGGLSPRRTVQLDYDVPVRLLPRYASVLARLRRGVLRGRSVWITSLVSHVRDPRYGSLFRGVVDGHVVQLFDTGDTFSPASVARLAQSLRHDDLPFMVGVATYERVLAGGRRTAHRVWIEHLPKFALIGGYRGVWVFPAGQRYLSILPST